MIINKREKKIEAIYPFPTNWRYRQYLRKLLCSEKEPVLRLLADFSCLIYEKIAKAENWSKKVFCQYRNGSDGIHITVIPYPRKKQQLRKVVAAMLRYFNPDFPRPVKKGRLLWHASLMSLKELNQFVGELRTEGILYKRLLEKGYIAEDLTPLVPLDNIKDYIYACIGRGIPITERDKMNIEEVKEGGKTVQLIEYKICPWCGKKHYKKGKWCSGKCRKAFCVAKKEVKELERDGIVVELDKDGEVIFKGKIPQKMQRSRFRERVKKVLRIIQGGSYGHTN